MLALIHGTHKKWRIQDAPFHERLNRPSFRTITTAAKDVKRQDQRAIGSIESQDYNLKATISTCDEYKTKQLPHPSLCIEDDRL